MIAKRSTAPSKNAPVQIAAALTSSDLIATESNAGAALGRRVLGERQLLARLQVHHAIPWRISHDNSPDNLFPLCGKHHKVVENLFLTTEEFGIDAFAREAWIGMLRQWQAATAITLKQIVLELKESAHAQA